MGFCPSRYLFFSFTYCIFGHSGEIVAADRRDKTTLTSRSEKTAADLMFKLQCCA